jgi:hypothetical protein
MIFALNLGLKGGLGAVILLSTTSSLISVVTGIFTGRSDMLIGVDIVMGSGFGTRTSCYGRNFFHPFDRNDC